MRHTTTHSSRKQLKNGQAYQRVCLLQVLLIASGPCLNKKDFIFHLSSLGVYVCGKMFKLRSLILKLAFFAALSLIT